MACVILPSEIARLVYGYLVKENLNEIALQFLENSPYLKDCCQIVKSGYQFNTKLMNKDLQELLQEYSVIHNLVNNKVSLLCKTSLLYKRIKLRCESLPEILDLILFWKYKISKNEDVASSEKSEKTSNQAVASTNEVSNSDVTSKPVNNLNVYSSLENSCVNETSDNNLNQNNAKSNLSHNNANINLNHNIANSVPDQFNSNLCCETYLVTKNVENEVCSNPSQETQVNNNHENESVKERTSDFMPISMSDSTENTDSYRNNEINDCDTHNDNDVHTPEPQLNDSTNVLTIDLNTPNDSLMVNEIRENPLESNNAVNEFESQIKIVEIEENQNQNHGFGVYSKSLEETNGNVNLENGSVVFVGSEVGNVAIDQESNQIIVIPIDYYKAQNELQSEMEVSNNENLNLIQEKQTVSADNDEIIFEGVTNVSRTVDNVFMEKSSSVDENIMTEKDFLENKELVSKLEKELKKPEKEPPPPPQETNDSISVHTVAAPLILVSQTVVQNKPSRYRNILPKKDEPQTIHPIVVVQPLLEKNTESSKSKHVEKKNEKKVEKKVEKRLEREVTRKGKKKVSANQKSKTKKVDNSDERSVKSPIPEKVIETVPAEPALPVEAPKEENKEIDVERRNEEKENLEKLQNKKTETPVFFTKRNSKRLSLSTPRRRNHIRALEFETPPKTSEDRKKSKTSPKAKVDKINVERKSVRNTLFKSPVPEVSFKSPEVSKEIKRISPQPVAKPPEVIEPLNELSIPIATRSPNTKLSDAWENLTGVGCVIGQTEEEKTSPVKKMWDADLRCFIPENIQGVQPLEKKRIRKPEKNLKDNRKPTKKKVVSTKKSKPPPVTVSPSKISLTAKRNTYSINGSEEGSPIRSLLDDLKLVTPFKDVETIRPTEETPLTKLLRENINTIDIDLSMINTPSFPPTPSIVITPDLEDISLSGANYYSPLKDHSKEKVLKITDYFKVDPEKSNEKKESKEIHEKVIGDLVSKAKEIIGMGKENQEENALHRPSGKILSMVKIQMLTQCDKKLCENIPINEETNLSNNFTNQTTLIGNLEEDKGRKNDLKDELEEKRKRALKKIKVVKENLSQTKSKVTKRSRKRKRSLNTTKSDKSRSDISNETIGEKQTSESDESFRAEGGIYHSTPNSARKGLGSGKDSDGKTDNRFLDEIRQEFPPFKDDPDRHPELTEKSRKKIHYVESFIKLSEIVKFITEFDENNPPKLFLKSSLKRFFQVFYKWLKHPHKRELNSSPEIKALLEEYLSVFDKINKGLNKRLRKDGTSGISGLSNSDMSHNNGPNKLFSDDEERDWKKRENERKKDEETEDGLVSTLPLKKRKSTVQQVDVKTTPTKVKEDSKSNCAENASQAQNFLQDIDVDRFLSQIHGQENR